MKRSVMRSQIDISTNYYRIEDKVRPNQILIIFKENWRDDPILHKYQCSNASVNRILQYMYTHGFITDARYILYGAIYGDKWE